MFLDCRLLCRRCDSQMLEGDLWLKVKGASAPSFFSFAKITPLIVKDYYIFIQRKE